MTAIRWKVSALRKGLAGLATSAIVVAGASPASADQGGAGGLPKPSPGIAEVSGHVRYELDRLQENGETVMVFKLGKTGYPADDTPLSIQAEVLDRLWGRQMAVRALPPHVEVRFGDTRYALISALQARLLIPGSGWDPRTGRATHGTSGPMIQRALAEVVEASPLPPVFARHGYRLRLADIARIEVGRPPSAKGARLPTEIDEMDFTADARR